MSRFVLVVLAAALAGGTASAQSYAVTAAGDTLRGRVEVRSPLLAKTYVAVDSTRYELEALREFRDDEDVFAVVDGRGLARLVSSGPRVDFYSRSVTTYMPAAPGPGGAFTVGVGSPFRTSATSGWTGGRSSAPRPAGCA